MAEIVNLFVYGTLMPGEANHRMIEDLVIDHEAGIIDGVLVDLGAFPALIPGDGYVKGVMLRMNQRALEITDQIEGYSPDRRSCLYLREEVVVQLEDEQEAVALMREWRPKLSLRDIAARLQRRGYLSRSGTRLGPETVRKALENGIVGAEQENGDG